MKSIIAGITCETKTAVEALVRRGVRETGRGRNAARADVVPTTAAKTTSRAGDTREVVPLIDIATHVKGPIGAATAVGAHRRHVAVLAIPIRTEVIIRKVAGAAGGTVADAICGDRRGSRIALRPIIPIPGVCPAALVVRSLVPLVFGRQEVQRTRIDGRSISGCRVIERVGPGLGAA